MVTHSTRGNDITGKFYFGGTKTRMDMQTPGGSVSNITDVTEKKFYMIMHDRRMYMEYDMNKPVMGRGNKPAEIRQYDPNNPCSVREGTTCKKVGSETVNGRACDKWEFMKGGKLQDTEWIDKKLHVSIKTLHPDGSGFEMQNVKEGTQPASTFDVPSGYQKLDMANMMQGMGKDH